MAVCGERSDGEELMGAAAEDEAESNELGTVLCKQCGAIVGTLPTRGVKTFYAICCMCGGGSGGRNGEGGCSDGGKARL